jgi:hypothetical protein
MMTRTLQSLLIVVLSAVMVSSAFAQSQIQLRRGSTVDWQNANPVLAAGEMGVDTDRNCARIGDGSSQWSDLQDAACADTISALRDSVTWTVGPTGDYATLEDAFAAAHRLSSAGFGALLFIQLEDGTHTVSNSLLAPINIVTRIQSQNSGGATLEINSTVAVTDGSLILFDVTFTGSASVAFDVSDGTVLGFGTVNSTHGQLFTIGGGVVSWSGDITAGIAANVYRAGTFIHEDGSATATGSYAYKAQVGGAVEINNVSVTGGTTYAVRAEQGGTAAILGGSTIADTPLAGSAKDGGRISFNADTTFTNVDTIADPPVGELSVDGSLVTDGATAITLGN